MPTRGANEIGVAVVTGAGGQDGYFLTERLLAEGWIVHALVRRRSEDLQALAARAPGRLHLDTVDLVDTGRAADLVSSLRPVELYNLAGESSISRSFTDPLRTWQTNAGALAHLLEAVRRDTPATRLYQASSSEMFGFVPGGTVVHDEQSPLSPQSPYASAKAAAHLLCASYRQAFDLRIACGILFNHESRRRSDRFLSQKVVRHVRDLARHGGRTTRPLAVGNLNAERDWGFALDYVDGMVRILRQVAVRADVAGGAAEPDTGELYRDYILCTGRLHAVWQLVDRAFSLGGLELAWDLEGEDPTRWGAVFAATGEPAVVVDPALLRPTDPAAIAGDPSRARRELGWRPRVGLDAFLEDMLGAGAPDADVAVARPART